MLDWISHKVWGEGEPNLYNVTGYFILSWMIFGFVRYRNLAYAYTARRPHEFGFEDLGFKFDGRGRLLQVRLKVWEKGDKLKQAEAVEGLDLRRSGRHDGARPPSSDGTGGGLARIVETYEYKPASAAGVPAEAEKGRPSPFPCE